MAVISHYMTWRWLGCGFIACVNQLRLIDWFLHAAHFLDYRPLDQRFAVVKEVDDLITSLSLNIVTLLDLEE